MKHHFGDFLDRTNDYWKIIPNNHRHNYSIANVSEGSQGITIVTIGKEDKNWESIFTLPNVEEVTLHEPSDIQLERISELKNIKRLRITHARPKNINFISKLINIEELVLEYVSGFSDLTPLSSLKNIKSLHIENLRKVSDFGALEALHNLRYLSIYGTLDFKQPIADFKFFKGLKNLEFLAFWQTINKTEFPALLPAIELKKIKRIKIPSNEFLIKEYALLSIIFDGVEGANWPAYKRFSYADIVLSKDDVRYHLPDSVIKENHPDVRVNYEGERVINDPEKEWFEFTGKKAGLIKCSSPNSAKKCHEYSVLFDAMKEEARQIIRSYPEFTK